MRRWLPRDMSSFLFGLAGLTPAEKRAARRGNLSFDGMKIQAGIKWQSSTGKLMGLAQVGSDYDGPTPQQRFIARAHQLVAAVDSGELVVKEHEGPSWYRQSPLSQATGDTGMCERRATEDDALRGQRVHGGPGK